MQRATQKIDFERTRRELDGKDDPVDEKAAPEEPKESPWESVRKNIVEALTEVRVLHDVLAVLSHNPAAAASLPVGGGIIPGSGQQAPPPPPPNPNQQKILTLASAQQLPITKQQQAQSNAVAIAVQGRFKILRSYFVVKILISEYFLRQKFCQQFETPNQSKKKALAQAGNAISKGADRLQKPTEKIGDFHQELLLLRQHYRLRRHGDKILGDLSFRTAGSRFNEQSTFEVLRDTECQNGSSPLRVRLPQELQCRVQNISSRITVEKLSFIMFYQPSIPNPDSVHDMDFYPGRAVHGFGRFD